MSNGMSLEDFDREESTDAKLRLFYQAFLDMKASNEKRFEAGNKKFKKIERFMFIIKLGSVGGVGILIGLGILNYKIIFIELDYQYYSQSL